MTRLLWEEEGQAAVEYALIAALISVAAVGVMATVGIGVQGLFEAFLGVFS